MPTGARRRSELRRVRSGQKACARVIETPDARSTYFLALGRRGSWATSAELGIFGQMLGRAGWRSARILDRTLGAVRTYDARRGADLARTAGGLFGGERSSRRHGPPPRHSYQHALPASRPPRRGAEQRLAGIRPAAWAAPCRPFGRARAAAWARSWRRPARTPGRVVRELTSRALQRSAGRPRGPTSLSVITPEPSVSSSHDDGRLQHRAR